MKDGAKALHTQTHHPHPALSEGKAGWRQGYRRSLRELGISEQSYHRWRIEYGGTDEPPFFGPRRQRISDQDEIVYCYSFCVGPTWA